MTTSAAILLSLLSLSPLAPAAVASSAPPAAGEAHAGVVVEPVVVGASSAAYERDAAHQTPDRNAKRNRVVSLPLVPHHALLDRRRRELRSLGFTEDEAESELDGIKAATYGNDGPRGESRRSSSRRRNLADHHQHADQQQHQQHHHQQLGALYQGYGTHYVDLWVGTPPQRQTVIVDTGSEETAFPCSSCKDCGDSYHTDSYFVEAESSTFREHSCKNCHHGKCANRANGGNKVGGSEEGEGEYCRIHMSYSEGSKWDAYEADDWCYAGGPHDEPLTQKTKQDSPGSGPFGGAAVDLDDDDVEDGDDDNGGGGGGGANPHHAASFAFRLIFGCQTSITGLFKTQLADGILGMENTGGSFWSQMCRKEHLPRTFALCFTRQPTASRNGTTAGAVTLGGVDERLHTTRMVYADNPKKRNWFAVHLRRVYLCEGSPDRLHEGAKIEKKDVVHALDVSESRLNSDSVIVDSGTTDTYLSNIIEKEFRKKFKQIVGREYGKDKLKLTETQLRSLPTVLFQLGASKDGANDDLANMPPDEFDGTGLAGRLDKSNPTDVLVAMPPSHYMIYDPDENTYAARLHFEGGGGGTLGANLMMGHDVHFDVENGRIGWAESDCDYVGLVGVVAGAGGPPSPLDGATEGGAEEEEAEEEEKNESLNDADAGQEVEEEKEEEAEEGPGDGGSPHAGPSGPSDADVGQEEEDEAQSSSGPGDGSSSPEVGPVGPPDADVDVIQQEDEAQSLQSSEPGSSGDGPPRVGPVGRLEDELCSGGCIMVEVVLIVAVAAGVAFLLVRQRRRRRPYHGAEAVPTSDSHDDEFDPQREEHEEEDAYARGGYSDHPAPDPPETELSENGACMKGDSEHVIT